MKQSYCASGPVVGEEILCHIDCFRMLTTGHCPSGPIVSEGISCHIDSKLYQLWSSCQRRDAVLYWFRI